MGIATTVRLGNLTLKNPVVTASGTFGYGLEFARFIDLNKLGGITTKGISLSPTLGNPPPRIIETPAGMLNAIGLQNIGVNEFLETKLPSLVKLDSRIIVNIYGEKMDDYCMLAEILETHEGIDAIELNLSCPNVHAGGLAFGTNPSVVTQITQMTRSIFTRTLIIKLTPNITNIVEIAEAAKKGGADALSLINTLIGMKIDVKHRKPYLHSKTGGLSGPCIHPIAVRMVWEVYKNLAMPIIGVGGIMNTEDALEMLMAGATAISVGTANLINPYTCVEIVTGIEHFLEQEGVKDIQEIIGCVS